MQSFTHMHTCTHTYTHTQDYTRVYIIYIRACTYRLIHVHTLMYDHENIHANIHAHTGALTLHIMHS